MNVDDIKSFVDDNFKGLANLKLVNNDVNIEVDKRILFDFCSKMKDDKRFLLKKTL